MALWLTVFRALLASRASAFRTPLLLSEPQIPILGPQPRTGRYPTTHTVTLDGLEVNLDSKGEGEATLLLTVVRCELRSPAKPSGL